MWWVWVGWGENDAFSKSFDLQLHGVILTIDCKQLALGQICHSKCSSGAGQSSRHHQGWLHGLALDWSHLSSNGCQITFVDQCDIRTQFDSSATISNMSNLMCKGWTRGFAGATRGAVLAGRYGSQTLWGLQGMWKETNGSSAWILEETNSAHLSHCRPIFWFIQKQFNFVKSQTFVAVSLWQDKVPPFSSSEAMSIIRKELGQDRVVHLQLCTIKWLCNALHICFWVLNWNLGITSVLLKSADIELSSWLVGDTKQNYRKCCLQPSRCKDPREIFSEITSEPVAAASLGQADVTLVRK